VLETVGRYKIQEKIGEGAMADVYRAFDPSINRALAVKVLKNEFLQDEEYAARFLREAKAAGALSHPNIVTIFDVGEVEGHPFIVMELLDGKPLDRAMAEKPNVNVDQVISIGMQLARALDYAHAQGIVHRDIKPSNIMISNDGQTVKILDYGIARLNDNDALLGQEVLKTQVGAVLGTPRYMSPEQALGQVSDGRSDLYSVGIVLYELLTGKKAFSSGSMATLMLQITQQDPEPISKLAPDIPGGLVFIVNKLLSKKADKRFQKGAELHAALKRELAAIESQKAEKTKPRAMPLPIKVTLIATAFVLGLLGLSIWAALAKQNKVMEQMAITSGSAIAGFVANNTGSTMAAQDWDQVSVFVNVAAEDKNVDDILVVDNSGIIRGAKKADLEGTRYKPATGPVLSSEKDTRVIEVFNKSGNRVFQFSQPVKYAGGVYGKVHVGLKQNELEKAAALSRNVLLGLGLLTLLSVMAVAYTIASVLSRPMKRLKEAFADAAKGNFDFRISHKRKDEFGELFDGFNNMATAVQARVETAAGFVGDAGSSPALKTGLNLPAATAVTAAVVLGSDALKENPFAKPVTDEAGSTTEVHETDGDIPEPVTVEVADAEPVTPAIDEADATEDMPDDMPEDIVVAKAETEADVADMAEPESADTPISEHDAEDVPAPETTVDDSADASTPQADETDEIIIAENSVVEEPKLERPESEQSVPEQQEPEHAEMVADVVPDTVPDTAADDVASVIPAEAEAHADTNNDGFEGDSDTYDGPMPDYDPFPGVKQDAVAPEAPKIAPVPPEASEAEDLDRTIVRSPARSAARSSLPVNPLARNSADDARPVADVSESVEEDMDRTVVRPPRR
jgi:eukaryotic-like serine/threonine-protein kinase